ncbi:UNVERIFIED_ORG: putative RNA methylase [Sphingomonas sp. R1F5B]
MVEYLGSQGDYLTLEPSAGTGNLSRALLAAGHSRCELVQVERHHALAGVLHEFGAVIQGCFLEYAERVRGKVAFPRIIMNPPFSQMRRHMAAARSLLDRGGHECATLVALVPVTFETAGAETLEYLDEFTFPTAKVRTKIIRLID